MTNSSDFDLTDFTPYLLNMAAETAGLSFQKHYRDKYGMLRTEWRVVFHLGTYGAMVAREISDRARLHKTKVSRAVAALEQKRYLKREESDTDRRFELLVLTPAGEKVFQDLVEAAKSFDAKLMGTFSTEDAAVLKRCLKQLAELQR